MRDIALLIIIDQETKLNSSPVFVLVNGVMTAFNAVIDPFNHGDNAKLVLERILV